MTAKHMNKKRSKTKAVKLLNQV